MWKSSIIASIVFASNLVCLKGEEFRVWMEVASGKKIEAKIMEKRADNSEIRIMLKNLQSNWIQVNRLSPDDQDYVKNWIVKDVKLNVQTVATARKDTSWNEAWANLSPDGVEFLRLAGSEELRSRVLGIEMENKGTTENFILEVFWLGFSLSDKNNRMICKMAVKPIKIPLASKWVVGASALYDYRDEGCLYLQSDSSLMKWEGIYARSWSGYSYAGWVVRLSDGEGNIVGQQGAQPVFLKYVASVPAPKMKVPKAK